MTDTAKHTPGPWGLTEDGDWLQLAGGHEPIVDGRYMSICVNCISDPDKRLLAASPDLLEALKPFAAVFEHDIGSDEADEELFQVNNQNRAPKLTVGDFRRAFQAVFEAEGQS